MTPISPNDDVERCVDRLVADGSHRGEIRKLFVPGRVELLGKHTDYCGGRSATFAIDRGFHVAYARARSSTIRLTALDLDEQAVFDFSRDLEPAAGSWANYPMSVARRLARNFDGPLEGAAVAFTSTLPQAAGMSSSSALVVATFLVLDAVNDLASRGRTAGALQTSFDLAEYLGALENGQSYRSFAGDRGVGTFGGSEDHTAITLGRAGLVSSYNYAPTRLEREAALPPDHVVAIASSGVIAEKTGAARERYNRSALLVRELVTLWNDHENSPQATLAGIARSGTPAAGRLSSLVRDHVADPVHAVALLRRLDHFVAESESIIPAAIDALSRGDVDAFAEQADRSQRLAHSLLQNQVPETRFLAESARQLGAAAASSFGAGFGGSVWALVARDRAATFLQDWSAVYSENFPAPSADASFFFTRPVDGTNAAVDPLKSSGRCRMADIRR